MAAATQKADVTLAIAAEHSVAAASLKAGTAVRLATAADGGVDCSTEAGQPLGRLAGADCPPLVQSATTATVRSIRKAPGSEGSIAAVTLRVVAAAAPQHAPLQGWDKQQPAGGPPAQEADDFRLPHGSLELLASSAEVRELLRSEQLRTAVAAVDSADRPEQALERALQNPAFNAFAEKVLATIGRGGAEKDDRLAAILAS